MNCDFVKSHGLGNDYIVMLKDERTPSLTVSNIRLLCDRNYGVGSDGILLLEKDTPPFGLRIFNPDGSEAEKSGNGLRIFSKFLYEYGFAKEKEFLIDTAGGRVRSTVRTDQSGRVTSVLVEMGTYTFDPAVVGIKERNTPLIEEALSLDGKVSVTGSAVSVGNPHFVFFVDKIDEPFIREFGTLIEHHPLFPRRINTQMVRVAGPNEIEIRIWERGAGYTQASGSSSCAAASCAVFLGKVKSPVTVRMPGGTLLIEVGEKGDLRMEGPVEEVMTGNFSRDFLERLKNNIG
ncbi:MAG: diaminopimelate epimerase [Nitrospiraceae bacterium]|nr:diaminopimelate epimerase [Nitrospiraceae bacterium]